MASHTIPVDIARVKSYANRLFDPACVPMRVNDQKTLLRSKGVVSGIVNMFGNGGSLGTDKSGVSLMFFDSVLHRSSSLADVDFTAFTGNPVNQAILFRGLVFGSY